MNQDINSNDVQVFFETLGVKDIYSLFNYIDME